MLMFARSISLYHIKSRIKCWRCFNIFHLYTPVLIHCIDELEGSLEMLDIDPLITSSVGFVGFIEYACCKGLLPPVVILIVNKEITTKSNGPSNIFLNNDCLYIKQKIVICYISIIN